LGTCQRATLTTSDANKRPVSLHLVEVVATYKLVGVNRTKLEILLHSVFAAAQLDLTIEDRSATPSNPASGFWSHCT